MRMRRWVKGITAGIVVGLAGAILAISPLYTTFERSVGLPWLFHLRGPVKPPPDVAVVAINGQTGEQLNLPDLPRDWPRSIHARLIDELVRRGASTIVFDMDFRRARDAEQDSALAKSVADAGRVVLFQYLDGKRQPVFDTQGKQRGTVWVEELHQPIPILAESARGLGPFPLPKIEASVEQFWVFKSSARETPTMPAVALQVHALDAYPLLLERLRAMRLEGIDALPRQASEVIGAEGLRELMLSLRHLFESNPGLKEQIQLAALSGDGVASQPADRVAALAALYSGPNNRYLNFYGPPGTIDTVPYQAVITGADPNLPPGALDFTGKVVFVGFSDLYDPGQPDRFYTVFTRDDGVDLSGVEIAATAFANMLTDRSLKSVDGGLVLAGILLFGLLMGAMLYLLPAVAGVPLALVLATGYGFFAQMSFAEANVWLPVATPLLVQFPLALFMGLIGQYLLERHKVKHISEAISYYLPESVHRELTAKPLDPASVNKVVFSTCLATDMSGFSTIAEKMNPGELAAFLNDYFDSLAQPLRNHGVDVTEFRADAIMCAWTGDRNNPDVRKQPILASLEASEAIGRFRDRHQMFESKLRIGLEAGEVYVGHAGGGGHFVYSIVGDPANTASRIEGLNKHVGTQILATGGVMDGIDGLITRHLGAFQFVGKTEAIPIYEILAEESKAKDWQLRLRDGFSKAMQAYFEADWNLAVRLFGDLRAEFPEDGPTKFFLSRAQQFAGGEAKAEDPGVVRMYAK